ncbi:D-inositol 3-phosphate glycosyltransferase [Granulosicoccus antarcticus IMCC3135]|uniref:D-inositol 3-phosphate glycosyltransferase n=1 Tax=Granulosicoccus antarcticus IMCC3135 TaxID=1192854 RepID=A0A2Z2NM61_9GAMM|nr:D-inositol 3-phosphate glycosyltransferase [Granulosicoccus antarcticus IMCC3135]
MLEPEPNTEATVGAPVNSSQIYKKKKILIVSHGHPDLNAGGGEIASYNLHNSLNEKSEYISVFFARHRFGHLRHGGTPFAGNNRKSEILFYSTMPDWFRFSQPDKAAVWRDFRQALEIIKPDVVHFHHYIHLGLEMLREVKNFNPDIPIILTLHEYHAICNNLGQMIKPITNELCHESSSRDCSQCFPKHTAQDFMLREQFIKSHFNLVDTFIAPSAFLKQRYVQWGIQEDRIRVIENLLDDTHTTATKTDSNENIHHRMRFAFFGQINWFKGLDILLEAINMLPIDVLDRIQLDINGSGLENQPKPLRQKIQKYMDVHKNCVRLRGPYRSSELSSLMGQSDWMIVPSRWWENSPMVILEAKKHGVPILCSDIGGMAEKVEHGKTGRHFMAGRAGALAEQILWAVDNPEQHAVYAKSISESYQPDESYDAHIRLYGSLLDNNRENNIDISFQAA